MYLKTHTKLVREQVDLDGVRASVPDAGERIIARHRERHTPVCRLDLTHEPQTLSIGIVGATMHQIDDEALTALQ